MSDDGWQDSGSRFEPRDLYSSADALDNTPLLCDEAYSEIPVHGEAGGGGAELASDWPWHCHWRSGSAPPDAVPQLVAAILLCALFMMCSLVGGYLAGSLAVMSDAAHLLSDCGGFALALLALRLADKPNDCRMSYGYRRAEVLGALASVVLIWILTCIFVYMACERLYTGEYDIASGPMLLVSGAGVAVNVLIALLLHGCCAGVAHHHSHGGLPHLHSHNGGESERADHQMSRSNTGCHGNGVINGDITMKEVLSNRATDSVTMTGDCGEAHEPARARKGDKNINLRAALIHVIGDLIQSCGVFVAALVIRFYPEWKMIDPICTFLFSVIVLCTTVRVFRDALAVLMQAVPSTFRYRECLSALQSVGGVRAVHSLHAWGLSTHLTVLTGHVVVDEYADTEQVLRKCLEVARRHGADSVTLQVERYQPAMARCGTCLSQPGHRA